MRAKYNLPGTSLVSHPLSCFISPWPSPFRHLFLSLFLFNSVSLSPASDFSLSCIPVPVGCSLSTDSFAQWYNLFFPHFAVDQAVVITFVKHSRSFNCKLEPLLHLRQFGEGLASPFGVCSVSHHTWLQDAHFVTSSASIFWDVLAGEKGS